MTPWFFFSAFGIYEVSIRYVGCVHAVDVYQNGISESEIYLHGSSCIYVYMPSSVIQVGC